MHSSSPNGIKENKDSILNKVYTDKNKVKGIGYERNVPNDVEAIYHRYLQAFKKGLQLH